MQAGSTAPRASEARYRGRAARSFAAADSGCLLYSVGARGESAPSHAHGGECTAQEERSIAEQGGVSVARRPKDVATQRFAVELPQATTLGHVPWVVQQLVWACQSFVPTFPEHTTGPQP